MKEYLILFLVIKFGVLHSQMPPAACTIAITRHGDIVSMSNCTYWHSPWNQTPDSISYCEEWTYGESSDSIYSLKKITNCPTYYNHIKDSVIRIAGQFNVHCIIPVINQELYRERIYYTRTSDSTWIGADNVRSYRYIQNWTLDSFGRPKKINICESEDSIIATYWYKWYEDGRIKEVIRYGDGRAEYLDADMSEICSYEYVYDDNRNLLCYAKHDGLPYQNLSDSLQSWNQYFTDVYPDSVMKGDYYLRYPTGSGLINFIQYSYKNNLLSSTFYDGFGPMSDTIEWDASGRMIKVTNFNRGYKSYSLTFSYDNNNQLQGFTTQHYNHLGEPTGEPSESKITMENDLISEYIYPFDKFNPTLVRHSLKYKW